MPLDLDGVKTVGISAGCRPNVSDDSRSQIQTANEI